MNEIDKASWTRRAADVIGEHGLWSVVERLSVTQQYVSIYASTLRPPGAFRGAVANLVPQERPLGTSWPMDLILVIDGIEFRHSFFDSVPVNYEPPKPSVQPYSFPAKSEATT